MNKFLVIVSLLIIITGCKNDTKKEKLNQDAKVEIISILDTLPLKLNASEKWIANLETDEGIRNMDAMISAFKAEGSVDYKTLGDNLSKQTSYIIKHCSMKGEPHDQLHVVLIPMLDEISVLKEEERDEKTASALDNLEQLISAYFKFFKV